jgi:hypothetical protein
MKTAALVAAFLVWTVTVGVSFAVVAADDANVIAGNRVAELLQVARTVVSGHQDLINDPTIGDKHLTSDRLVNETIAAYTDHYGRPPITDDLTPFERRLTEAQLESIREVVDEQQPLINTPGIGFKGFIPAVFARLVNERFAEKMQGHATVKVTAPLDIVRNRLARPDAWERATLENKFLSADWPVGQPYVESLEKDKREVFRMLIPEYYVESCLVCHGKPAGEMDVTGYPKEGRSEGDLAGAISIMFVQ